MMPDALPPLSLKASIYLSIYLSIYRLNLKPFLGVLALMLALAPPTVANSPCSPTGKLPLIIHSPPNGAVIPRMNTRVSGSTDPCATRVTINGTPVSLSSSGAFSLMLPLHPGPNVIVVTATDANGRTATQQVLIDVLALPPTINDAFEPRTLAVDAFTTPQTQSNLNGILEPGETVAIAPTWFNLRTSTALTGTVTAWSGLNPTAFTILTPSFDYGLIPAQASASCTATGTCALLALTSVSARPATHWDALLRERLSSGGSFNWTVHIGRSFTDVPPSHPHYAAIEAILHHHLTTGCGSQTFCPTDLATRATFAAFLARLLTGGAPPVSGTLPTGQAYDCHTGGSSAFPDLAPTHAACAAFHTLAALGIIPPNPQQAYDPIQPASSIDRATAARWTARALAFRDAFVPTTFALNGRAYACTPGGSAHFTDIPLTHPLCRYAHFLWVHRALDGFIPTPTFHPTAALSRAQAARLLADAFHLATAGPQSVHPAPPPFPKIPNFFFAWLELLVNANITCGNDVNPNLPCALPSDVADGLAHMARLGASFMRVFASWPDPSQPNLTTGTNINDQDKRIFGWSPRNHREPYPLVDITTGAPCATPSPNCQYDLDRISFPWLHRLRKLTLTARAMGIEPCLVLLDTAWFHAPQDPNHHPWDPNGNRQGRAILKNHNAMLAEMLRLAALAQNNAQITCVEAINEPHGSGAVWPAGPASIIALVQDFNHCAKKDPACPIPNPLPRPFPTVIADDTYASASPDCYNTGFADAADFFMLHSAALNGKPHPACEIKACLRAFPPNLQARTVISDDGSHQSTFQPMYFTLFSRTYFAPPFGIEIHFHKLAPPAPNTADLEGWTPAYWRATIHDPDKLPAWSWPDRNPAGLPAPPPARLYWCEPPARSNDWAACHESQTGLQSNTDPIHLFLTSNGPDNTCTIARNTTPLKSGCTLAITDGPLPPGTYPYATTCSHGADTLTVQVSFAPMSGDLKVNGTDTPDPVNPRTTVSLTWTSQNTQACQIVTNHGETIVNFKNGSPSCTGPCSVTHTVDRNTTYTLRCRPAASQPSAPLDQVTVNLQDVLQGDITVNNLTGTVHVVIGRTYTLRWSTIFAAANTRCEITKNNAPFRSNLAPGPSGEVVGSALETAPMTIDRHIPYVFACSGDSGSIQKNVTVHTVECLSNNDCPPDERCSSNFICIPTKPLPQP